MQRTRGHILRQCWLVWLLSVSAAGLAVVFGLEREYLDEALLEMGVVFALYAIAAGTIAGRARDISTVIIAVWGGAFGFWAMHWLEGVTTALRFAAMHDVLPSDLVSVLRVPVSIASAGAATGALLYLATGCPKVAANTFGVSLLASLGPLVPGYASVASGAGAVLWHAAVGGSVCMWAAEEGCAKFGTVCRGCGEDLRGVVGASCPVCGRTIDARTMSNLVSSLAMGDGRPRF